MLIKEITIRKARRSTVKSTTGNYDMNEADISLTIEAEEGKLDIEEGITKVKELVDKTMNNDKPNPDPDWIKEKQPWEPKVATAPTNGAPI